MPAVRGVIGARDFVVEPTQGQPCALWTLSLHGPGGAAELLTCRAPALTIRTGADALGDVRIEGPAHLTGGPALRVPPRDLADDVREALDPEQLDLVEDGKARLRLVRIGRPVRAHGALRTAVARGTVYRGSPRVEIVPAGPWIVLG